MYVDNSDLLHWGDSVLTEDEELISSVQAATDDFASLVQASGGALKPSKCFAYFLCYHTVNGKTKLKPLNKLPNAPALVKVKQKDSTPPLWCCG